MMPIAVCLLTCDRNAYTATTLRTFDRWNHADPRMVLLHADDASTTDCNVKLAATYGFETVVQSTMRRGWLATRIELFERAAARGLNWILLLENDIESLRPFPWPLFDAVQRQRDIYCLRLYGRFKNASKTAACLDTHKRRGHMRVDWRPWRGAPEPSQVGRIHWSAQPCVTRVPELLQHHRDGAEPDGLTVRVKKNVTSHFGVERTPPATTERAVA